MNSRWRKTVCLILGALLLSAMGCGGPGKPKVAKVKGVVKYRGQPLANAGVAFHPANGRTATGQTDDNGEFTLSTFGTADGAIIGEHTVTVSKQDPTTIPWPKVKARRESNRQFSANASS